MSVSEDVSGGAGRLTDTDRVTIAIDRCLLDDLRDHLKEYHLLDSHEVMKLEKYGKPPSHRIVVEKVIIQFITARTKQ